MTQTTLAPHQLRVVKEESDLLNLLAKLETFFGTDVYSRLPPAEQVRLARQHLIMQLYVQVLGERISAFEDMSPIPEVAS